MTELENGFAYSEDETVGFYRLGRQLALADQTCFEAERLNYPQRVTIRFVRDRDAQPRFDLDHQHIARVMEQGFTTAGDPYQVLEPLAGEPLDIYCDKRKLSVRARIGLVLQVIDAATYAHQHLSLHGDLSCRCILVSSEGLKLLGFGDFATSSSPSVDSDIRSIGRILVQLLSGVPTVKTSNEKSSMRVLLSSLAAAEQAHVAEARGIRLTQLRKALNADLEAIASKALATGENYGYETCAAVGEDLRRYLDGYPVAARSASKLEIGYTWSCRHPAPVIAVVALLLCLLTGGVVVLRSTAHARHEEHTTNERLAELVRLTGSLDERFYKALGNQPDELKMRVLLLDQLRQTLDEATKDVSTGDPANCLLAAQYRSISQLDATAGRSTYAQSEAAVAHRLQKLAPCGD